MFVCSHAHFEEFVLLHVEDAEEALPAVVAAEGLFAGVLSNIVSSQMELLPETRKLLKNRIMEEDALQNPGYHKNTSKRRLQTKLT